MAASSSLRPKKTRYTLPTVFLLFFFLLSLFFFSRRALESKFSLYRDEFSDTPLVSSLPFLSRFSGTEVDDIITTTPSGDAKGLETYTETPTFSKSDLDDHSVHEVARISSESETPVLSKSDIDGGVEEVTPFSSESETPIVSESDNGSGDDEEVTPILSKSETPIVPESDVVDSVVEEVTPILSQSETPVLSKSDIDSEVVEVTPFSSKSETSIVSESDVDSVVEDVTSNSEDDKGLEAFRETPTFSKSDFDDSLIHKVTNISSESIDNNGLEASTETPILSKSKFDDNLVEEKLTPYSSKYDVEPNATAEQVVDSEFGTTKETRSEEQLVDPSVGGEGQVISDDEKGSGWGQNCDFYQGTWVKDEDHPIYKPGSCPYVDEAFDCQNNGRPDSEYLKWRWKPDGCDLPRFNATDFLNRLRGKKLMLVGDSMNRNQFESLLCLLREGLIDKSRMHEIHGHKITKGRGYYFFKFKDYDCSVEFVRSHFLVREGVRINAQGNSNPTLSIDRIDKTSARWRRADILVFNTGHWWAHGKTARGKNYYKERDYIYPKFDGVEAYRRSLKTWAKWIDENMSRKKLIIYRGYSNAHFRGGDWDSGGSCNGETEPVLTGAILENYPVKMKIVQEVIKEMKFPVVLLNVTRLTNFRKDGHPSVYGKVPVDGRKVSTRRQDCSHWCLPGVPDAWNELIYATLVLQQTSSGDKQ